MDDQKTMAVGMGEIEVTRDAKAVLAAYGLGSCVGVSVYDPVARVGGLAHVMLPNSREAASQGLGFRFADIAVPALIQKMQELGASPRKMVCRLAGGAHMLFAPGSQNCFNIGDRNVEAVHEALRKCGVVPVAKDVGGSRGRTVRLFMGTGQVFVKIAGQGDTEL